MNGASSGIFATKGCCCILFLAGALSPSFLLSASGRSLDHIPQNDNLTVIDMEQVVSFTESGLRSLPQKHASLNSNSNQRVRAKGPSHHCRQACKSPTHYCRYACKSPTHYRRQACKSPIHYRKQACKSPTHYRRHACKSPIHYRRHTCNIRTHYRRQACKSPTHYRRQAYKIRNRMRLVRCPTLMVTQNFWEASCNCNTLRKHLKSPTHHCRQAYCKLDAPFSGPPHALPCMRHKAQLCVAIRTVTYVMHSACTLHCKRDAPVSGPPHALPCKRHKAQLCIAVRTVM